MSDATIAEMEAGIYGLQVSMKDVMRIEYRNLDLWDFGEV